MTKQAPRVASLYELLGGETALRAVIDDFVERVFADVMIGFFFRDATQARIKLLEFQHAAEFLGGPQRYRGRSLAEAHAKHRIMGGQFDRRTQILREVLKAHGVPEAVQRAWLAHVESLRGEVTTDPGGQCIGR
jgi:hemoglobin